MTHPPEMENWQAFTLVELSIVLVIVGLVIGGVFIGKDMIEQGRIRNQISQIENFKVASNTFKNKYNCLAGDCPNAQNFGLQSRNYGYQGDGLLNLYPGYGSSPVGAFYAYGEMGLFFRDLSDTGLIPATNAKSNSAGFSALWSGTESPEGYFPRAVIRGGVYVGAWSGSSGNGNCTGCEYVVGKNFYTLAGISTGNLLGMYVYSQAALTPVQAYAIDVKIDDGNPQQGTVLALVPYHGYVFWAQGTDHFSGGYAAAPGTAANPAYRTCYDNQNNASNPMVYSISNWATSVNCEISIAF